MRSLTNSRDDSAQYTDTVGVLTSWTNGVLIITRRDGSTVHLDELALAAGKVVPAAPARRRGTPAASVRELQWIAARGWPAVETEALGEWTLRASGGFTARANSLLPLGTPDRPLPDALEHTTRWYGARGLSPLVQVTTGAADSDELLGAELEQRGWSAERHALLRVAALAPLADREPDSRVLLRREPGADWLAMYRRAGELADVAPKVLTGGPSVWFAAVPDEERRALAAIGRCVVDGRWAGFAAVEVAPERRREGLAGAVMGELARQALAEGASAAYLQVESGNAAAKALYDGLGFTDHHAYHYRRAPRD